MSQNIVNVFVSLGKTVPPAIHEAVTKSIQAVPGVITAVTSARTNSLVRVDYDPKITSANSVLQGVRGHVANASLVGM